MGQEDYRLHWKPDAVAYRIEHFRSWLYSAPAGERCLYHIGHILVDQANNPALKPLSDYVTLMAEFGVVIINHKRIDAHHYQYFATRTDIKATKAPQAVGTGDISVRLYLTLRAIHQRETRKSVIKSIRDAITCSEDEARKIVDSMIRHGIMDPGTPPNAVPQLTETGLQALK